MAVLSGPKVIVFCCYISCMFPQSLKGRRQGAILWRLGSESVDSVSQKLTFRR